MSGNKTLIQIMSEPKKQYRPWLYEVEKLHSIINAEVFDGQLNLPKIQLKRKADIGTDFGWCEGFHEFETFDPERGQSLCVIGLVNTWTCIQSCVTILAHEMIHQWQWDVYSFQRHKDRKPYILSHGPTFWQFKPKLASFGIPLHRVYPPTL